jgi:hypothetical protein
MPLPEAVQRQLDEADRIEKALAAQQNPEIPPVEPQQTVDPAPQAPDATPQQQAPAPVTPEPPKVDDWKQRYDTLMGKYQSEVPRLIQQAKDAATREQALNSRLDQLEVLLKASTEKPTEPQKPAIDPKDAEAFGGDLVEMVQRVATAALEKHLGAAVSKVDGLVDRFTKLEAQLTGVTQTTAKTAEESFYSKLAVVVPDYEQVNTDPRFLEWLGQVDPVYGVPRQAALDAAANAMDATRVANVFTAFKATIAPTSPPPAPTPKVNSELAKQVAPATATGAAPTVQPQPGGPVSIRAITEFYDQLRRGEWKGKEQAAAVREAEINAAIETGNLMP